MVHDAEKAALGGTTGGRWRGRRKIDWCDIIGSTTLATCRAAAIASKPSCSSRSTSARIRGVTVSPVDMRDIVIPGVAGRDVAEGRRRAKQARIILTGGMAIAAFEEAAKFIRIPVALQPAR